MKYSLRSLMIAVLVLPPLLALAVRQVQTWYVQSLITETGKVDWRMERLEELEQLKAP